MDGAGAALHHRMWDQSSPATGPTGRRDADNRSRARTDLIFTGMCDASGAVELSRDLFAVADDEDNVLRIYDANRGGAPLSSSDVSGRKSCVQ